MPDFEHVICLIPSFKLGSRVILRYRFSIGAVSVCSKSQTGAEVWKEMMYKWSSGFYKTVVKSAGVMMVGHSVVGPKKQT